MKKKSVLVYKALFSDLLRWRPYKRHLILDMHHFVFGINVLIHFVRLTSLIMIHSHAFCHAHWSIVS